MERRGGGEAPYRGRGVAPGDHGGGGGRSIKSRDGANKFFRLLGEGDCGTNGGKEGGKRRRTTEVTRLFVRGSTVETSMPIPTRLPPCCRFDGVNKRLVNATQLGRTRTGSCRRGIPRASSVSCRTPSHPGSVLGNARVMGPSEPCTAGSYVSRWAFASSSEGGMKLYK